MESVMHVLNDSGLRTILCFFSAAGPFLALLFFGLLISVRTRRLGVTGLLIGIGGAAILTAIFHYSYVMRIWEHHDSAVWALDIAAFRSGFTVMGIMYLLIYGVCKIYDARS